MLQIRLLGRFHADFDGVPLKPAAIGSALPLLALLLLERSGPRRRSEIAFRLWPDEPEADALANLRRHLHLLCGSLPATGDGPRWVLSDRSTVRWNPDCDYWLDVDQFERLSALVLDGPAADLAGLARAGGSIAEACRRATQLYRGDLLLELYDDWVVPERERLANTRLALLARMVAVEAGRGDLHGAVTAAERLLEADVLREESHRLVIALRHLAGDRAASLCAFQRCRNALDRELSVQPMAGTVRLAGAVRFGAPAEEVLALLCRDLPQARDLAPALQARVPNNVPRAISSFVGRRAELEELSATLSANRLVTVVGPAGSGKSCLAAELARRLLGRMRGHPPRVGGGAPTPGGPPGSAPAWPDGIWWVDLAAVDAATPLAAAVAAAIDVQSEPGVDLQRLLERKTRPREMLLVLDNAEGLVGECAAMAGRLLRTAPGLRVLVTSREVLGFPGEAVWRVPPLSVPPPDHVVSPAEALLHDAPRLLADRAARALPGFEVIERNVADVVAVCRHLDGNPLAIELAAARVRDLPVAEIAARLQSRLELPSGGDGEPAARHGSLRAAIDCSHELLTIHERMLLRRLSVFRGGCQLAAAEAVCADDELAAAGVLDLLAGLVDKSLVVVRASDGMRRHELPESVRRYSAQRLEEAGEADRLREAHLAYYLALAEEAEPHLRGANEAQWLDRLELDHGNLRTALAWAVHGGDDAVAGRRLAAALWRFWVAHNHVAEGREWLARLARACADEPPSALTASMAYGEGTMALAQGLLDEAASGLARALALYRDLGDLRGTAWALNDLGCVAANRRDYSAAATLYEESLDLKRALGACWDVARTLLNLGELAWRRGDLDRAAELYDESLRSAGRAGGLADRDLQAALSLNLGDIERLRGDLATASEHYREALLTLREIGDQLNGSLALAGLGGVAAARGQWALAARLLASASAARRRLCVTLDVDNQAEHDRMVAAARARADPAGWEAETAEGERMPLWEAARHALEDQPTDGGGPAATPKRTGAPGRQRPEGRDRAPVRRRKP